jgi:hypothetical protein
VQSSPVKSTLVEYYFTEILRWIIAIGSVILSTYLIVKTDYEWISILMILVSLITISTKYRLEVDTSQQLIIDSFQMLWITMNTKKFVYHELKCIRLDKEHHAYTANSRARTAQTDFFEYIGTLEYDDQTIELTRHVSYETFGVEMKRIAGELQIPLHRMF